jgi:hypothetical protein
MRKHVPLAVQSLSHESVMSWQRVRIANWLAGHRDLSGMQRAILASLGQAITDWSAA